jgi:hypothetical protein
MTRRIRPAWDVTHTRYWRERVRLPVLQRDGWICRLCHKAINPLLRAPHPMSPTVHHTLGARISGNDMRYLVAAHRICNLKLGDPSRRTNDPKPRGMTLW